MPRRGDFEGFFQADEAMARFLIDYSNLLYWNTEKFPMGEFSPVDPLAISIDSSVIDLSGIKQQIRERSREIACLYKAHYDQIADSDAEFIPYWTQEITFTQAVKALPPVIRRRLFESYSSFFEKNDLPGRRAIDVRLENFSPFFSDNDWYWAIPSSDKEMKRKYKSHHMCNYRLKELYFKPMGMRANYADRIISTIRRNIE
ncbi:hypothetical protein ACFL0W_03925 [Nanoarchaeota archaeon]